MTRSTTRSDLWDQHLRLPEHLFGRLRRAAKEEGLQYQQIVRTAVERFLDDREDRRAKSKADRNARRSRVGDPVGLFGARQPDAEPVEQAPAGPVVVNVNAGGAPSGGYSIDAMAKYVVDGGADWRRDERLEEVCKILKQAPPTEHVQLAEQLDKAIDDLAERRKASAGKPSPFDGFKKWLSKAGGEQ